MSMRVFESVDREEEITKIVFDPGTVTMVIGLFEVETCSGKLDQCAIKLFLAVLSQGKAMEQRAETVVKSSFQRMTACSFDQCSRVTINPQRIIVSARLSFQLSPAK